MIKRIRQFSASVKAAILLAFAGVILYSVLSVGYAFTQRSTIDEGLYQYKGYLFASGTYHSKIMGQGHNMRRSLISFPVLSNWYLAPVCLPVAYLGLSPGSWPWLGFGWWLAGWEGIGGVQRQSGQLLSTRESSATTV